MLGQRLALSTPPLSGGGGLLYEPRAAEKGPLVVNTSL